MSDKCLLRIEDLLEKSSIRSTQKDEILDAIKLAQQEMKVSKINEINVDKVAQEVTEQIKLQKKINKRNAIENEIKIRKLTEFVIKNFSDDPEEGLISILVGTNRRVAGARDSVAIHQQTSSNQLIAGFNRKLRENNLEELFADADKKTQERVAIAMEEINQRKTAIEEQTGLEPPIRETDPTIAHPFPPSPPCANHTAVVNTGSSTVNVVGLPIARKNDSTDAGQMTEGSNNVNAGG